MAKANYKTYSSIFIRLLYPQKTAGDIEKLETEKLAATRQWRRRRQRKILRKERELAAGMQGICRSVQ